MIPGTLAVVTAACLALAAANGAAAQTASAPDASKLDVKRFAPDWDAVCAGGKDLGQGCERIRARRVLDASEAPWRAIGRVNFASTRIRGHCTGTLVGERLVVTAAHCLYNLPRKSWIPAGSVLFAAGYQRGGYAAVSRVKRYVLDPANDPDRPDFTADPPQDWALLVLEEPIGRETGWIAPRRLAPDALEATTLVYAGYAALREHVLTLAEDCGAAALAPGGALIVQTCPVMAGDSGGPILAVDADGVALVGTLSILFRDGDAVASGSVPVDTFAAALRRELGPGALPELERSPADPADPADPAPLPETEPVPSVPVPPRGR